MLRGADRGERRRSDQRGSVQIFDKLFLTFFTTLLCMCRFCVCGDFVCIHVPLLMCTCAHVYVRADPVAALVCIGPWQVMRVVV